MDIGGAVPIYKLNDRVSFLLVKFEYCRFRECLESWSSLEHSMMDSSMLYEYGHPPPPHPPDIIHMIGVPPRPSPFFTALLRII